MTPDSASTTADRPTTAGRGRSALPSISIIVPTYKEVANLPGLIQRVKAVIDEHQLTAEMLIMDDDSNDGSVEAVAAQNEPWVRIIVRKTNRGLSPAVLDGFHAAKHDILLCMDADLSHPPEKIPELMQALVDGADFVIGSRYIRGGSTDAAWGMFRWLNSKVATLLAAPFTTCKDPMAGFFALKRDTFHRHRDLNPIGYKIGLELLVKCGCSDVREVPIHFADRQLGESKLSFKEQVRYVEHVRRLYTYRFPARAVLLQFLLIGLAGTAVNLLALAALLTAGVSEVPAFAAAIVLSLVMNTAVIRLFNLSGGREGSIAARFLKVVTQRAAGGAINFLVAWQLWQTQTVESPYLAALVGILAGMPVNLAVHGLLGYVRHRRRTGAAAVSHAHATT